MLVRHISFLSRIITVFLLLNPVVCSQTIVGEFGNYKITLKEFEDAYVKNVGSRVIAEKDSFQNYKKFMDLYMNFRMKLRNAEVRGFNHNQALNQELKDYQEKVGKSYIIEKYLIQPGIEKLYNRRKEELRVSHIMIRPVAGGDEAAFEKANTILDSIKNGESFEEMAQKYSDDKYSSVKGGDIYYVTAGMLPYEFEDAMYTLHPGEIYSKPVKTNYGQHLIKVTQRQQRVARVRAKHILISYTGADGKIDSAGAKLTADSVLAMLKSGADFNSLAMKYSDDTGTKNKGGDLGYFERRQMVQPFDEAVFNLKVGEISGLVQTNFGYHIIKLVDKQDFLSFEADMENLKKIYQKQRYQADYSKYIEMLKNKFNYILNDETVDAIVENCDSSRFGIDYPHPEAISGKYLFSFAGTRISAPEFITEVNGNNEFTGKPIFDKNELLKAVNKVAEDKLMNTMAMNLDKEDSNFAALMDEYRNGVYIFKLQEDEVWNKLNIDSTKIYNYWKGHKDEYSLPDRISFGEIFSKKDSLIQKYYKWLKAGADFDSLAALYTEKYEKEKDRGRYEKQAVDFSEITREANKIENPGEITGPVPVTGGYSIFKLYEKISARLKTFNEAKAEVSGIVQEMESKRLEKEYINSLTNIYHPVIFYDELQKAFKKAQ